MLSWAKPQDRIIVALDCSKDDALSLATALSGRASWVKIGMTLFYAEGPSIVTAMKELGFKVFLDLKLHDIPHQIKGATESAVASGADLISVHAAGSAPMIQAARTGVIEQSGSDADCAIVAITVLTSMDQQALSSIGVEAAVEDQVRRLAELACSHGADGVVCSPKEAKMLRELLGDQALIVTPGVRPEGADLGDQSRVATPAQALADGASMIVIGRPITAADDPVAAFDAITAEL